MRSLVAGLLVLFGLSLSPVSPAADFTGNGKDDLAIFRSTNGLWAVRGVTRFYFGSSGDIPVPGDYFGGTAAEGAIFRPGTGLWAIRGVTRIYYGTGVDVPLSEVGGGMRVYLPTTRQTMSYRTGDDGTYQKGRDVLADNGDGTVTDLRTGLMWPKDGTGAGYANGTGKSWNNAIDWAEGLSFAGYTDWRLPNVIELKSFQEITWGYYRNQSSRGYWSSTTLSSMTAGALYVYFSNGEVDANDKSIDYSVVAVRGP